MSQILQSSNKQPFVQYQPPYNPQPPASYNASATVTATQILASQGGSGAGVGQATFHPNWNHVVATTDGKIFCAFNYFDDNGGISGQEHTTTHYRVVMSADLGATFTTIYDSNGVGQTELPYGMSPALETDGTSVYLIANHYPRANSSPQTSRIVIKKFSAPFTQTYTNTGTTIATINASSNKFSAFFDLTRNWIWISV